MNDTIISFKTDEDVVSLTLDALTVCIRSLGKKIRSNVPFINKEDKKKKIDINDVISIDINDEDSTETALIIHMKGDKKELFTWKPKEVNEALMLRERIRLVYLYIVHKIK